ncbi:SurA N-terminal domain containing protein [Candidatus Nanopelagicaceae bacterium]
MKKFTAVTIASVAAIALFLTGCSQVGAAATVGSTKITQATVQTSIDTVMAERSNVDTTQMQLETGEELNRSQLRFHLFAALLKAAAKDLKITVSKAEIDTRREAIIQQVGGVASLPNALVGAGIASTDFDIYLDAVLNSEKIQKSLVASGVAEADVPTKMQDLVIATGKKYKVTVNPRYGVWKADTAEVTAATSEVVSPAATPAE